MADEKIYLKITFKICQTWLFRFLSQVKLLLVVMDRKVFFKLKEKFRIKIIYKDKNKENFKILLNTQGSIIFV